MQVDTWASFSSIISDGHTIFTLLQRIYSGDFKDEEQYLKIITYHQQQNRMTSYLIVDGKGEKEVGFGWYLGETKVNARRCLARI